MRIPSQNLVRAENTASQQARKSRRGFFAYFVAAICILVRPSLLMARDERGIRLHLGDHSFPIKLPERLDLTRVQNDCQQLSALIQQHPDEMNEYFEAVIRHNDFDAARRIGERLALKEETFTSKGGGLIWLVVAVVIIVVVSWPKKAH